MKSAPAKPARLFEPWAPPANITLVEVAAIKAVANGTASEQQQRDAMNYILVRACGIHEDPYCPGENGNRDTAYAAGKRRVGLHLVSLINTNINNFKDPDAAPREQP